MSVFSTDTPIAFCTDGVGRRVAFCVVCNHAADPLHLTDEGHLRWMADLRRRGSSSRAAEFAGHFGPALRLKLHPGSIVAWGTEGQAQDFTLNGVVQQLPRRVLTVRRSAMPNEVEVSDMTAKVVCAWPLSMSWHAAWECLLAAIDAGASLIDAKVQIKFVTAGGEIIVTPSDVGDQRSVGDVFELR